MTLSIELDWQGYRYFPYELQLARREVAALLGAEPQTRRTGLRVVVRRGPPESLLERMTYFREIRLNGSTQIVPRQTLLEATGAAKCPTAETLSFLPREVPILRRQSTRYSAHGLHEYKGKFHPHIVRAIGNILSVPQGAWILDPFCGSGTSLLESAHSGWNAVGVDRNPLGVLISNTKIEAMRVPPDILRYEVGAVRRHLENLARGMSFDRAFSRAEHQRLRGGGDLIFPNRAYLEDWFSASVLSQLAAVAETINRIGHPPVRNIARIILSDGLRTVSLQDPGDLRIRRRKDTRDNYPAIPLFISNLVARTGAILRAREVIGDINGLQVALLGDSRSGLPKTSPRDQFDCVITSPPYATALPYIDTQRLSLAFLGLVDATEIHRVERSLIGNREITERERSVDEEALEKNGVHLPEKVRQLCLTGRSLVSASDGFRRRNVPALLFRYFTDMARVFSALLPRVRPGATFALLVGPNRTTLGGIEIRIETPELLAVVAEHVGWECHEIIALDAYRRFDIHQKNSITSEALVLLRRPGANAQSRAPKRGSY